MHINDQVIINLSKTSLSLFGSLILNSERVSINSLQNMKNIWDEFKFIDLFSLKVLFHSVHLNEIATYTIYMHCIEQICGWV